MNRPGRAPRRALGFALALAAGACAPRGRPVAAPAEHWLGTWAPSQQLVEPRNLPPAPLAHSTLRQVFRVSLGGPRIRVHLSNLFGDGPIAVGAARIARSAGGSAIEPASERPLTFGGADSVTISAGHEATSDPLDFPVAPLSALALTLRIGAAPAALTGHPGSRTTSYLAAGDHVSEPELSGAATTEHWYVIAGLDVVAEGAAVVTLGNSITDGRGSGTNQDDRWPDDLARRLQADPRTARVAVLNAGIGGNCLLRDCLGPAALSRLDRDVLEPPGVRWVIVLEGVNDIGNARAPGAAAGVAQGLIDAYRRIIARAHARGLKVYGATITPFGGSFYDGPERQAARDTVNRWIRTSGAFDAVIDFDATVRDPSDPSRLQSALDTGDHLHPNEAGYHAMADAIELSLFTP
ncbi:MAG TPA: SGNH/GDSL hydrolase family protein [Gemmatimonadales bacterium]|nr:SGNH/GDSL hydrolase family protein [Gemmatimonadales bacterium]